MDFAKDSIKARLAENGYDPDLKSLFIIEGLVPYIPAEALAGLLDFIAENNGAGMNAIPYRTRRAFS